VRAEILRVASAVGAAMPSREVHQEMGPGQAAYRVSPAELPAELAAAPAGPAILGWVFAHAVGVEAEEASTLSTSFTSSTVASIPLERAGAADADLLTAHPSLSAADEATVRAAIERVGALATGGGATHAFTVCMDESGDWSELAVLVLNATSGDPGSHPEPPRLTDRRDDL
jgi:hypothetical protein